MGDHAGDRFGVTAEMTSPETAGKTHDCPIPSSPDFYLRTFAAIGMHEAMRFPAGPSACGRTWKAPGR